MRRKSHISSFGNPSEEKLNLHLVMFRRRCINFIKRAFFTSCIVLFVIGRVQLTGLQIIILFRTLLSTSFVMPREVSNSPSMQGDFL